MLYVKFVLTNYVNRLAQFRNLVLYIICFMQNRFSIFLREQEFDELAKASRRGPRILPKGFSIAGHELSKNKINYKYGLITNIFFWLLFV